MFWSWAGIISFQILYHFHRCFPVPICVFSQIRQVFYSFRFICFWVFSIWFTWMTCSSDVVFNSINLFGFSENRIERVLRKPINRDQFFFDTFCLVDIGYWFLHIFIYFDSFGYWICWSQFLIKMVEEKDFIAKDVTEVRLTQFSSIKKHSLVCLHMRTCDLHKSPIFVCVTFTVDWQYTFGVSQPRYGGLRGSRCR